MNVFLPVPHRHLILTLVTGACLALFAPPSAVNGATFTVTKETDDDGSCEMADCSLREAILATNALPGKDTIIVPGGTYTLSIPGPGEDLGFTGALDVRDDVEIVGDEQSPVVIVGDGSDRVLSVVLGSLAISNVTITGGVATTGVGGGIYVYRASLVMKNCSIRNNTVPIGDGGGLYVSGYADVVLENCTISNNFAERRAGGIMQFTLSFAPSDLTLINTTVSGNSAARGGAIYATGSGSLYILNSTIANNHASSQVDGLYCRDYPQLIMANTIMADDCGFFSCFAPTSYGGNLESPGATCYVMDPTDQMNVPDVRLGPLAANGGPTMTHALLGGSPAIDSAVDANCPETDQRGVARPVDGDGDSVAACDTGAYEAMRGPFALEVPALAPSWLLALALLLAGTAVVSVRRRPR